MATINRNNYFQQAEKINFSSLPEPLRKGHEMVLKATKNGEDWSIYEKSDTIRNTLDLYFEKLSLITNDRVQIVKVPDVKEAKVVTMKKRRTITEHKGKMAAKKKGSAVWGLFALSQDGKVQYPIVRQGTDLIMKKNTLEPPYIFTNYGEAFKAVKKLILKYPDEDFEMWRGKENKNLAEALTSNKNVKLVKTMSSKNKKSASKVKKDRPAKASSKRKVAAASKPVVASGNTEHLTPELVLIKRFAGMEGRTKTKSQVLNFTRALQKAIKEKKVTKTSPNAAVIKGIQQRVVKLYNTMVDKNLNAAEVSLDSKFSENVKKLAAKQKVYNSIPLLKRFINMQGINPTIAAVEKFLKAIKSAIKNNKFVADPYVKEVENIQDILNDYLGQKRADITLEETSLAGLMGIPQLAGLDFSSCKCKKKSHENLGEIDLPKDLLSIFSRIDEPATGNAVSKSFVLPTDLGKFLGRIERLEYALLLRGEKGAGKTRLLYQLLNLFASQKLTVAHFSLEISKKSDLVSRMTEAYIDPKNLKFISVADELPKGISTIREAAKYFDVVAIDSFSKIGVPQTEFDKLRKDFPDTFFIVVFQSTTAGTARGGSAAEFDAGAVLQVNKGGLAEFEKNRYDTDDSRGLVYDLNNQRIVKEEKEE